MNDMVERLKEAIAVLNATQNAFASKANIDPSNFGKMLEGKQKITDKTIGKICHAHKERIKNLQQQIQDLQGEKKAWEAERKSMKKEIEELRVKNEEITAELSRTKDKMIDFIFFSDATSRRMAKEQPEDEGLFRISPKMLIRAAAFFQGKCLANFEDIGYSNIEEVTQALVAKFPADIPDRSMVQFKIVNLDNGKVYVYEHQKGKGF